MTEHTLGEDASSLRYDKQQAVEILCLFVSILPYQCAQELLRAHVRRSFFCPVVMSDLSGAALSRRSDVAVDCLNFAIVLPLEEVL